MNNMDDMNRMLVLIDEIGMMKNRYEENAGMGNLNTAISVLERRVEELQKNIRISTAASSNSKIPSRY